MKQLQVHKKNLFELSLPNRVTKIIEARPNTTIREAIVNVLKKYNYSLEVMEIKLTNTLQVCVHRPLTLSGMVEKEREGEREKERWGEREGERERERERERGGGEKEGERSIIEIYK